MSQLYTLTVSKFNNLIKDIFNCEELLHNVEVSGEVFGVSYSKNATYFSIKDSECSLPCVCFYLDDARNLKEGDSVVVTGSPNFYAKSGRFNFVVSKIKPFGVGNLFQNFLLMKEKLEKEGLFDASHKKQIPQSIKRIGVVTSKDGAVIQDIKNVTWRRNPAVDIVLYDTKVQGNGAEKEIVKGIEFFSQYDGVDVVVVARGGGSLEDLSAYNTEVVARAAYACEKPLISAVGHETDFTIIDFVSDLRAPTPSAAAELLTKDTKGELALFKKDLTRTRRLLDQFVADQNLRFSAAKGSLVSLCEEFVLPLENNLKKIAEKIGKSLQERVKDEDFAVKLKLATLKKLNPLDILSLGYAKIEQNGVPVAKKAQLDENQKFEVYFADGNLTAKAQKGEEI